MEYHALARLILNQDRARYMKSSFTIDEDGITIILSLDSQYEKAVARILKEFEVTDVQVLDVERSYHVADPEVKGIRFRMTRKTEAKP